MNASYLYSCAPRREKLEGRSWGLGIHPLDAAIRWTEGRSWMIDNIRIQDLNKLEAKKG